MKRLSESASAIERNSETRKIEICDMVSDVNRLKEIPATGEIKAKKKTSAISESGNVELEK